MYLLNQRKKIWKIQMFLNIENWLCMPTKSYFSESIYVDQKYQFFWITILKFNSLMNSNVGRFMLESLDLYQKCVSMLLQFDRIFSKLLNYTIALPVTIYHPRIPIRSFLASAQLRDVIFYYLAKGCRKVRKWSNVKKNVL